MRLLRLPIDVLRIPAGTVAAAVTDPLGLASSLGRLLGSLERMADDVAEMRDEVARMRAGVDLIGEKVDGLRADVRGMDGNVGGIRSMTESMDHRIDELAVSLEDVARLATRFGWLGGRRNRAAKAEDVAG